MPRVLNRKVSASGVGNLACEKLRAKGTADRNPTQGPQTAEETGKSVQKGPSGPRRGPRAVHELPRGLFPRSIPGVFEQNRFS